MSVIVHEFYTSPTAGLPIEELVEPKWPTTAVRPQWLVLFSRRPRGFWAGGLFGDGGNLGGLGPAAGSSWRVRGVRADGASVLQL